MVADGKNLPPDFNYDSLHYDSLCYDSLRASNPVLAGRMERFKQSIFLTTIQKIDNRSTVDRLIAVDTGAHDYLDNKAAKCDS